MGPKLKVKDQNQTPTKNIKWEQHINRSSSTQLAFVNRFSKVKTGKRNESTFDNAFADKDTTIKSARKHYNRHESDIFNNTSNTEQTPPPIKMKKTFYKNQQSSDVTKHTTSAQLLKPNKIRDKITKANMTGVLNFNSLKFNENDGF